VGVRQPAPLPLGETVLRAATSAQQEPSRRLRALGNRWLEVLWHCLTHRVSYNDAIHAANRTRALNTAPATAA
jgi:hypothetical protein